ncbi:DUF547 domain-containing protein [Erythrobacter sp.]|nr:DUF547 domain-containing protein [Erythrobacter sp.]
MVKALKPFIILGILPALVGCAAIERLAIPKSEAISTELQAFGTQSQISNQAWDAFLENYTELGTDNLVRVNYLAVTTDDKQKLEAYIDSLEALDTSLYTRDAQLAYWINLYNAATVSVILDNYPVDSIRDITSGLVDPGPWNEKRIVANGRELSLNDIEHGIVRPLWPEEPRIHYAFNCAAIGCPNLAQSAYTAENITQRLQENAVLYVNDPRGVSVAADGSLTVSKIFNWYRDDFGRSDEAIINHLKLFAKPDLKQALEQTNSIDQYAYDWSLNDTATAP